MRGLPVTIRLLDPPLHEFLTENPGDIEAMASRLKLPLEQVKERYRSLHEVNPMLGHRGCRLGLTFPEIYEMQVRGILEAAVDAVRKDGVIVEPEIMIPLVGHVKELEILRELVTSTADAVQAEYGLTIKYMTGTMIELPRACLTADQIAVAADFFSFGTNDLTQTTFGVSRDDCGRFLPLYIDMGILPGDPFVSLDPAVGELVQMAIDKGRRVKPGLKLGICGEHGGDPASVEFCHRIGLDYVSCSPFRVPVARLAAAQAALEECVMHRDASASPRAALSQARRWPPPAHAATREVGTRTPPTALSYPVSVTADPSGRLVWVVSGNFDLAWRGAAVLAIDVLTNQFVPELAFEIGNFPGPLTFLERDGRAVAGYIASREEDNLYTVAFGGDDPTRPTLTCADGRARDGQILQCPESGSLQSAEVEVDGELLDLTVGDDPYTTLVRPGRLGGEPDLLFVGGMADGVLATLALAENGTPRLIGNLELANGLYGLANNPASGRLYASSKLAATFSVLAVGAREDADDPTLLDPTNPYLRHLAAFAVPEPGLVRDRARALAISKDGTRLYATYRAPDSLVILDIADDPSGGPRGRVLQKVSLADDPNDIEVVTTAAGDELLYVSCFRGDRIEILDARSGVNMGNIRVGQGPSDMTLVDRPDLGIKRLYVALFNDNAVSVIELDPASPFYQTEIGEIR